MDLTVAPAPARSVPFRPGELEEMRFEREDDAAEEAHIRELAGHSIPGLEVACTACGSLMWVLALRRPVDYLCTRCEDADHSWNRSW